MVMSDVMNTVTGKKRVISRLVAPLKFFYSRIQVSDVLVLLFVASSLILSFRYSLVLFLKYLLASRLMILRLPHLFHLDSVTTAV
jgi:hypothetical protein